VRSVRSEKWGRRSEEIIDKSEKRLENEKGESEVYSLSPFFISLLTFLLIPHFF